MGRHHQDLTGMKFGRLTVLQRMPNKANSVRYLCQCDCGRYVEVSAENLRGNITKSCGCLKHEVLQSRKQFSPEEAIVRKRVYNIWRGMKSRTLDPNNHKYPSYGGRGITIDDRWKNDFESFYRWSQKHGYKPDLWIDRINNDGPYSPKNCRWTTQQVQANNTRTNKYLSNGQTVADYCRNNNLNKALVYSRLELGKSEAEALDPSLRYKRHYASDRKEARLPRCERYGFNYWEVNNFIYKQGMSEEEAFRAYAKKYDIEDIYENMLANDALANDPDYLASLYQADDNDEDH